MSSFAISAPRVFDGVQTLKNVVVLVQGGRISDVVQPSRVPSGTLVVELTGGTLAPGFIDLQVNGGGGALLNDHPSMAVVTQMQLAHRRYGTVGMLPTIITDRPEVMWQAIAAVREARASGNEAILGVHVEGPFLDIARKGAHDPMFIRELQDADVGQLLTADAGKLLMTLAPNKVPLDLITRLSKGGVIVSLGHADASYEEAGAALAAGATCFTHMYNAMSQLQGRNPGMVGAALRHSGSYVGLIADGLHVHDGALRLAITCKGVGRCFLVSDAMSSAAGGPDHFELQGRKVMVRDNKLQLADGTLAGSNLTMDAAVRHAMQHLGVTLNEALRMASLTPAECLGLGQTLGRIAPGYMASLVHLDEELKVSRTWVAGI